MPSPEPSPRPWRIGESASGTMSCIHDANGEHIASCFGIPTEADAALIVDAVNNEKSWRDACIKARTERNALLLERDRLRDIVRRIEAEIERCHRRDDGISQELMDAVYEARSAIGEDAP